MQKASVVPVMSGFSDKRERKKRPFLVGSDRRKRLWIRLLDYVSSIRYNGGINHLSLPMRYQHLEACKSDFSQEKSLTNAYDNVWVSAAQFHESIVRWGIVSNRVMDRIAAQRNVYANDR